MDKGLFQQKPETHHEERFCVHNMPQYQELLDFFSDLNLDDDQYDKVEEYAEANNIIYVDYHTALADENMGLPKTLSNDGCHPNPDTYFLMEEMVVKAINEALKR